MPPPVFRWFSLRRGTSLGNVPESYPASVAGDDEKDLVDDTSSRRSALVIVHAGSIPMPSFQVKRVDCYYSSWSKLWKYRNTNYKVAAEGRSPRTTVVPFPSIIDQWKDCALVLVRTIPIEKHLKPTFKYIVNSLHIKTVCQDVIRSWPGIDWGSDPLEISPKVFIAFYRRFCIYRDALKHKPSTKRTVNESYLLASVSFLIDALGYDFGDALKELDQLLSKKETTFGHLCNLFIPGTLLVSQCRATNLPRVYLLTSVDKDGSVLECESMDVVDGFLESTDIASSGSEIRNETKVGKVKTKINLRYFDGTVKITDLAAYPIMFHPNEAKLREQLIERGKKWLDLIGVHHKQYDGPAIIRLDGIPLIQKIKSRIMVDRASFGCFHPSYSFPAPVGAVDQYKRKIVFANACLSQANVVKPILSDEELLLTPTVVHGFSLSDKLWLEFNINLVKDVEWNDEAFKNLVLPAEKKSLLQSVVDVHHRGLGVNDFVKEKGQGLVINLSGPPGTGTLLSLAYTSIRSQLVYREDLHS
ncbi:hypothetical protein AX15_001724 [Amanita polypyramis BW_CC]|nr:hypothetical protein AX15_001724 [Amanita polypyramis BW_CC]